MQLTDFTLPLLVLALLVILALSAYALYLLRRLHNRKRQIEDARRQRSRRLKESVRLIGLAMQKGHCDYSEGVIRLKMLLDPLGAKKLNAYPAMYSLYQRVMDMPTHEARRKLEKRERMRQDHLRISSEAELAEKIKLELHQLLADINGN
ncbi:uncharacterized protein DUF2489 [Mesocricetibacter intestinalis]|uniref:Uncharacterized protein DUF2489 n=1 Tax=Mesocricetibacter intestinalis TaxID=1521930 RepID=A0A4R6VKT8_9PAST|nr:DUF2489 domain-containing protein [Mesocricetibacter intestinalis]TDQ59420.1 uncharacterized protein DUF2489 [Mesocricetibacter intestinalis]